MATVLYCAGQPDPSDAPGSLKSKRSVRSLAHGTYLMLCADPLEKPTENRLRPLQRAVNRCSDHGYLDANLKLTARGALVLARHPMGQPSKQALQLAFALDTDEARALQRELSALADNGSDDAAFLLSFLYWNWRRLDHERKQHALSPRSSLGGKGGAGDRNMSLPFEGLPGSGVDRAKPGALPQPPCVVSVPVSPGFRPVKP